MILESKSKEGEEAVLICSEKLTDENWKEIKLGELIYIDEKLSINKINLIG
ncbi:MAG: hypothetical protein N3A58_04085 [Spirochaetes bacterium]|nr:hypothetical protein [Spirochaetota bacterium]